MNTKDAVFLAICTSLSVFFVPCILYKNNKNGISFFSNDDLNARIPYKAASMTYTKSAASERMLQRVFLIICALLSLIFASYIFYKNNKNNLPIFQNNDARTEIPCKVAIMTYAESPIAERMRKGFIDTLKADHRLAPVIRVYSGNGDRNQVRSQVEDVVNEQYDLICTLGVVCSQMAKEITTKKDNPIPLVFGGFTDPVKHNIVPSMESSGSHVTGVALSDMYYSTQKITLLKRLKPSLKNALILYNAQSDLFEQEVEDVAQELKKARVTVKKLPVYNVNEVMEKLRSHIESVDVIITLRDNVVLQALQGIIKLCNLHHVTLFTSELESVDKGAALGFGQDEYETGVACGKKALEILAEGKHPSTLPITSFFYPKLKINVNALKDQGLEISDELLFLMKDLKSVSLIALPGTRHRSLPSTNS